MTDDPPDGRHRQELDSVELAELLGAALLGDDDRPPTLTVHLEGRPYLVVGAIYDPQAHVINVYADRRGLTRNVDPLRFVRESGRLPSLDLKRPGSSPRR